MSHLLTIITYLGPTVYLTVGNLAHFQTEVMRPTALACLLVIGGVVLSQARRGLASHVDKAMVGYLALASLGFWAWPEGLGRLLAAWPTVALYAFFALTVLGPLLLGGRVFTEFWARRQTPEAVWETPIFKTINRHMSWVWAGLFALCGLLALIPTLVPALQALGWRLTFDLAAPLAVLVGLGVPFNKWYPSYYQRRMGLEPVTADRPAPSLQPQAQPASPPQEVIMSSRPTIVAINGSPHAGMGNTAQMLEMLRPALSQAGFDLEVVNLAEKKIGYCVGCGLCLEKGKCWQNDDHPEICRRLLEAAGIILACPVYFLNVTAQMKTFLDRSLGLGHKPRGTWKPGLVVCVSAGLAEVRVAEYMAGVIHAFGAFSVGSLTAMAVAPGQMLGREWVERRARKLALDLAEAIKDGAHYPATGEDLHFYQFMSHLIQVNREFMKDDDAHWRERGLYDSFEAYIGQTWTHPQHDPAARAAWLKQMIADQKAKEKGETAMPEEKKPRGAAAAQTCRQLLEHMPQALDPAAAGDLKAILQFEISGGEEFTAHLAIEGGRATFVDGPTANPTLTIQSPADVWLGISQGKLSGQAAFMAGQFKAKGDFSLLMRMNSLFKK